MCRPSDLIPCLFLLLASSTLRTISFNNPILLSPPTPISFLNGAICHSIWGRNATKKQEKRIEVNEMRMLRWMCGVTCKYHIRNEHITGTTRVMQVSKKITERRLNWYGHATRRDEEHILRKVLRTDIPGKTKRGRPKTRWKDTCQRDLQSTVVELPKSEPGNVHKCLVFLLTCIHIGYRKFLSFIGIEKTLGNFFY